MSDRDLYSRLLLTTGNGYPLSYPQPSDELSPECQARGLEIGDVGALSSDGSFNVFFNICRPHDDPANRLGVPVGFEHIDLGSDPFISNKTCHLPGSHISNTKVEKRRLDLDAQVDNVFSPVGAGAVIGVSSASTKAAILLLPDGASRLDLRFVNTFKDLALRHAQSWYAFVTTLRTGVENGDLYLITGTDKSVSWGVAAARHHTKRGHISLKLSAVQTGSAGGSHAWSWEANSTFADMGPRRPPGEAQSTQNQTVFLRGYRIAIPLGKKPSQVVLVPDSKPATFFRWLKSFGWSTTPTAAVEPPRDNGSAPHNDDSSTPRTKRMVAVEYSPTTRPFHPADAINKRILESFPEASAAVIHDDEWTSVLEQNEEAIPDESELIRRIFARYETTSMFGGVCLRDKSTTEKTLSVGLTRGAKGGSVGYEDGPRLAAENAKSNAMGHTVHQGRRGNPAAATGQGRSTANDTDSTMIVNELKFSGGGFGGRNGAPGVTGGRDGAPGVPRGRATGQGGSTANDTDSMMIPNGLKVWGGGYGGRGGAAENRGGAGGNGQGPRLAPKYIKEWDGNILGGYGGTGGLAVDLGGTGGVGERPELVAQTLYQTLNTGSEVDEALMDMPLKDFCTQYKLSQDIFDRFRNLGFTTAGALFEIEDGELEKYGFTLGHISELKRAWRQVAAGRK